jgi:chromosome partitioning protein
MAGLSYNGGVGKSTTAVHVAVFMQEFRPTILADGDIMWASSKWTQRNEGKRLPLKAVPIGRRAGHLWMRVRIESTSTCAKPCMSVAV